MTIQQLRYAVEVVRHGSFNEAAKALFITQPSLSSSIKALEDEYGIKIFERTNKGAYPTEEGAEFLGYARQILQQTELLEERYKDSSSCRRRFAVSTHHYLFAANAFVELVREFGGDEYEFSYRESKTWDIIQDVHSLRSDLGLIYISGHNEEIINRLLRENELDFCPLFTAKPHVFLCKSHPLAHCAEISPEQLEDYPCVSFEQGDHSSSFYSEEVWGPANARRSIKVTDRAAVVNFMIGLNGYNISTGVFPEYLHGDDICAIPLRHNDSIRVGYIVRRGVVLSPIAGIYLDALRKIADDIDLSYNKA